MNHSTDHWLDLYEMTLEALAGMLAQPDKFYDKLGIQANEPGAVKPAQMTMEKYNELRASWKRVKHDIKLFGLQLSDELELEPMPQVMASKRWRESPWLTVARSTERNGIRFTGRDALTAFGFINFFIQLCDSVDPAARIRSVLESQGINKDNFDVMVGKGTGIKNPWKSDDQPGQSRLIMP